MASNSNKYKIKDYQAHSTMAPNGSEFSHRVWISFFIFYSLALSLRNFSGSHCILLMYIDINLLRNRKCTSNWKAIAGVISQWFWCNYLAYNFILYSKSSEKKWKLPVLYLNTFTYLLWVPGEMCLCLGVKKRSVTIPDNTTM